MSRGALLALLAMAAIYAYRFKLSRKLLFVLSVVPLALLIVPALFFTRLQNALVSGGAGRLDIWTAGLSAITVFGLQGSGLENFPIAYERFAGFAPVFRGYERAAHNIYLQTAVELGILGVVLLLCAIRLHLKDLRPLSIGRITSPQPMVVTCEAMAIGMLVASFFVGTLWQKSFWMVWIFCTLAARTHKEAASVTQPVLHRVHYLSYAVSSF
jgi:O-antigen ligase